MTAFTGAAPATPSARRVPPPGALFYLATLAAILIALDVNSRRSLGTFLIAAPIWLLLAAAWLVRFLAAARRTGLRMPPAAWVRWLVIPLAMALVFLITRTDAPFSARLALSRGAMDQLAAEVMAGGRSTAAGSACTASCRSNTPPTASALWWMTAGSTA